MALHLYVPLRKQYPLYGQESALLEIDLELLLYDDKLVDEIYEKVREIVFLMMESGTVFVPKSLAV